MTTEQLKQFVKDHIPGFVDLATEPSGAAFHVIPKQMSVRNDSLVHQIRGSVPAHLHRAMAVVTDSLRLTGEHLRAAFAEE